MTRPQIQLNLLEKRNAKKMDLTAINPFSTVNRSTYSGETGEGKEVL